MKLTKAQKAMKKRIENAYLKKGGFRYQNPSWDKKLWGRTNYEIREFFLKIFETALDEVEYYSAIIYLWRTVPDPEVLVEFHQSPQWRRVAKTYDHIDRNKPVPRNKQDTTEGSVQSVETVKLVETIHIIGDD